MFGKPLSPVAHTSTGSFCTLLSHFGALMNIRMRSARPSHAPLLSNLADLLGHS